MTDDPAKSEQNPILFVAPASAEPGERRPAPIPLGPGVTALNAEDPFDYFANSWTAIGLKDHPSGGLLRRAHFRRYGTHRVGHTRTGARSATSSISLRVTASGSWPSTLRMTCQP